MEEMSIDFFLFFCFGLHFVQWSGTVLAILVEVLSRNNPSFDVIRQVLMEEMLFEDFFYFSSGRHFVQRRETL